MPSSLPVSIIELATNMFARNTGFSGPEIHRLFADHTEVLGMYPQGGGSESRWALFQKGLKALSREEQREFLLELCKSGSSHSYAQPSDEDIARLRGLLSNGAAPGSAAASEKIGRIEGWERVRESWDAALLKIVSDPEGAITASRTTLESVCKHICDERGVEYDKKMDLARLYKAAAAAMRIAPDQHSEQVVKQILSGTGTVVDGLAALRNSLSDSHGRGKNASGPAPRHAKLAVNVGFAVAEFLIDTHLEKPK